MRLQRLSADGDDGRRLIWDFHEAVTVIDVRDRARSSVADLIVLALGFGSPGLHLEAVLDSGRRVVAFRPHGARHVLLDVDTGEDLTAGHQGRDGRIRVVPAEASDTSDLLEVWHEASISDLGSPESDVVEASSRHRRVRLATLVLGPALPIVGVASMGTIGSAGTLTLIGGSMALTGACFVQERRLDSAEGRATDAVKRVRSSLEPVQRCIRLGRRPTGETLPLVIDHRHDPESDRDPHRLLTDLRALGQQRQLVMLTADHGLLDAAATAPEPVISTAAEVALTA